MGYFLYNHPNDNVIPAWSAVANEDPGFPAVYMADLSDLNLGLPAKLTATSGDWLASFVAKQRVDLVVIWHNFDPGLVFHFQGNDTNAWGSPSLDVVLTADVRREDGFTYKLWTDLTAAAGYITAGYKFYRLHVPNANSVPIGAKVWLGSIIRTLDRPIEKGFHLADHHAHVSMVTDFGYRWSYDLISAPRILSGQITLIHNGLGPAASLEALQSWYRACSGPVKPTLLIPDQTWPISDAWLVRWMSSPSATLELPTPALIQGVMDITRNGPYWNPVGVAWQEVSAGEQEWV